MAWSNERRSCPRVSFGGNVQVIRGDDALPPCACFDLSEGGLRVALSLPAHEPVEVLFSVPPSAHARLPSPDCEGDQLVLLLRSEVVWMKRWCTGLRFLDLPPDAREHIRSFVEARA
jgi:hypothetical protein